MMKKSFTLIEILIVVAIIGIITSIIGVNFSASQKKARDSKRIADMNTIVGGLNAYKREKGDFPQENVGGTIGGWETSVDSPDGSKFLEPIKPYVSRVPIDPKNSGNYYYAYRYYENGSGSCTDENRDNPFVILSIKSMEITNNEFKERATCNGYDWGSRFDYSIKIMK
jgi:type II secretion system protein G